MKLIPLEKNLKIKRLVPLVMYSLIGLGMGLGFFQGPSEFGIASMLIAFVLLIANIFISRMLQNLAIYKVDNQSLVPPAERESLIIDRLRPGSNIKITRQLQFLSILVAVFTLFTIVCKKLWESNQWTSLTLFSAVIIYFGCRKIISEEKVAMKHETYNGPDIILEKDRISISSKIFYNQSVPENSLSEHLYKIRWTEIKSAIVTDCKSSKTDSVPTFKLSTHDGREIRIARDDLKEFEQKLIHFTGQYSSAEILLACKLDT